MTEENLFHTPDSKETIPSGTSDALPKSQAPASAVREEAFVEAPASAVREESFAEVTAFEEGSYSEIIGRRARRRAGLSENWKEEAAPQESFGDVASDSEVNFTSEDLPSAGPRRGRGVSPQAAPKVPSSPVAPFIEFVEIIVGALVAAILVLTLICRTGVVDGDSMVPTMHEGDRYIISDLFYTPQQNDIVVFRPKVEGENELWIKRVIAVEGQTVYIDPDTYRVFVDGVLLDEPYLGGMGTIPHTTQNPITVPEGCVYVLGDNRAISKDSRYRDVGCVEIGQLAGRVILRFWPLEDFGFCK